MLSEWRKFKGWSVLEFFLANPEAKIHIKELARVLNISPQTSNRYLRLYEADGILRAESTGNVVQFSLESFHPMVRELQRLYSLLLEHENKAEHKEVVTDTMDYVYEEE